MTARLVRALQKGGVTAKLRSDQWGVWRQRDRRGRIIGCLSDREVERLQLRECLKPFVDVGDALIWCGAAHAFEPGQNPSHQSEARLSEQRVAAPYIESIILKQTAPTFRESLRQAVLKYRRDMQAISVSSASVTMNWERLHVRNKQTRAYGEQGFVKSRAQRTAALRLRVIEQALSPSEFNFLTHLVCAEASKAWLAKHHALRVSLIEPRALSILRRLISAQANSL